MIDSGVELCCCAAYILLSTFGTCDQVDDIGGSTCERVPDGVRGLVAGVIGFECGRTVEVKTTCEAAWLFARGDCCWVAV